MFSYLKRTSDFFFKETYELIYSLSTSWVRDRVRSSLGFAFLPLNGHLFMLIKQK